MEKGGKMIDCRGSYIKNVVDTLNLGSYLEIGLSHNPLAPYRMIDIENKTSIDMDKTTEPDYLMSSDVFFNRLKKGKTEFAADHKWDAIFIDGDHMAPQVYKDLCNSFDHLTDKGIIFMHDVLPWSYYMTIESPVGPTPATCQDAWKVLEYCLKYREDMNVCTIEENGGGLGVITKNLGSVRPMLPKEHNQFFQYKEYEKNKTVNMNTIKQDYIFDWIKDPTYNYDDEI